MNQNQPIQFSDIVLEELLRQNTVMTRDLAIARAEVYALKQENEMLKEQISQAEAVETVEAEVVA